MTDLVREYREALEDYGEAFRLAVFGHGDRRSVMVSGDKAKRLNDARDRVNAAVRALIAEGARRMHITEFGGPGLLDVTQEIASEILPNGTQNEEG